MKAHNLSSRIRWQYALLSFLFLLPPDTAWTAWPDTLAGGGGKVTRRGAMLGAMTATVIETETRQPVPGASVFIIGTKFGGATGEDGRCDIHDLPGGTYTVAVSAIGFRLATRQEITITPGEPVELIVPMEQYDLEMDGVDVHSPPFPRQPDAPVSTFDQTSHEIRRLPGGFDDVVRAASILPGVAQLQTGRNDLVVRGGAPAENLYFIDGVEMPSLNHFGTQGSGGGPLSFINLDLVEGTSFSSGGFGVRYGDKLSAIMSVDLREGRRDRFGGKAVLSLTQFGLVGEGPLGERGSTLLSIRRSYLDPIARAAGLSYIPEFWDVIFKSGYDLGTNDRLSLLGVAIFDRMRPLYSTPTQTYDNAYILHTNQQQFAGGITWRHRMANGYTDLSITQNFNTYDYLQHDVQRQPIFTNNAIESATALKADAAFQAFGNDFSFGGQLKLLRMDAAIRLRLLGTTFGNRISANADANLRGFNTSAYVQAARIMGILRLQGGVRVDHFDLIVNEPLTVSPRFSLTLAPLSGLELTLMTGNYAQVPSLVWLAANPQNRQLPYIRAEHLVAGASYLVEEDMMIRAEAYIKRYHDYPASTLRTYLTLANTGAGFGGLTEGFASFGIDPLVPDGMGRSRGVELSVQKKPTDDPWYGMLSITLSEAQYAGVNGVLRPGSYDQRWIGNFGAGWRIDEAWSVSARARLATGRPYTPFTPAGRQYASEFNTVRTRTNHQVDLRIDRRWDLGGAAITAFLDIQNVYNHKPDEVPFFNNRTKQIDRIKVIGILPAFGASVEF